MSYIPGKPTWQIRHPNFSPALGAGIKKDMTIDQFFGHVLFPVIATPKFDGIRCLTIPGEFHTNDHSLSIPACRSLDPVPNEFIAEQIAMACIPGLDGELMSYLPQGDLFGKKMEEDVPRSFNGIQSDVMTRGGRPRWKFHVFDFHDFGEQYPHLTPYEVRLRKLDLLELPSFCVHVPRRLCSNRLELEKFEEEMVAAGYEGICWRHALSPYKYGRSTLRQQALIKMKRFETAEAVIIDSYEEMGNHNPSALNALGYAERTSHRANMIGKGTLGGLTLRSSLFEFDFNCGSGFTAVERAELWIQQDILKGKVVTFKFQRHGSKDRPRIPIFVGFRDKRDL